MPEVAQLSEHQWMALGGDAEGGGEAEYVYASASTDGVHWNFIPLAHRDRAPVQHGLASMVASGAGKPRFLALKRARMRKADGFDALSSTRREEIREESLPDVCACCPTLTAKTAKGLLLAYRAHAARCPRRPSSCVSGGRWAGRICMPITGTSTCPTNAASVATAGDRVAISGSRRRKTCRKPRSLCSSDSGSAFTKLATVSTGHSFGYTSVVLDEGGRSSLAGASCWGGAARVWLDRYPSADRLGRWSRSPPGANGSRLSATFHSAAIRLSPGAIRSSYKPLV